MESVDAGNVGFLQIVERHAKTAARCAWVVEQLNAWDSDLNETKINKKFFFRFLAARIIKTITFALTKTETPRSSSWPRTQGFHP